MSMMLRPSMFDLPRIFDSFDNIYEQAMLPEAGTTIVKTRTVTDKYKVSYAGDGTVCLENLRYEPITEEKDDS